MYKIITAIFILLFYSTKIFSQVGFERHFGTPGCYEEGSSVISLGTNGYLISAAYNCGGGAQNWNSYLIHLDTNGDTLWSIKDMPYNGLLSQTNDGNYLFAGGNVASKVYDTIEIVKVEPTGNVLWSTSLAFGICANLVSDVKETANGYVLSGYFMNGGTCATPVFDGFVAKLDLQGNLVWQTPVGGKEQDQLHNLTVLADGSIMAIGWTSSDVNNNLDDYLLVKLDANGSIIWRKQFGNEYNNFGYGITTSYEGGVLVNGYSANHLMEVHNIDANGNIVWRKEYAPVCGSTYFKVAQTQDGGYALLGTEDVNNNCTSVLMKIDAEGDVIWKKNWSARLREFKENADSSFVLTGYASYPSDVAVILFDSTQITSNTTAIDTAQDTTVISSPLDTMDIRTSVDEDELNALYPMAKLHPNPATNQLTIEVNNPNGQEYQVQIFTMVGQLIYTNSMTNSELELNISSLAAGSYIYKISAKGFDQAGKFIVKR